MSPEKLLNIETGWKNALCEFIHPLVKGDVMCNKKQLRIGRTNVPLMMYGMVSAPYISSKYMGWKVPHMA